MAKRRRAVSSDARIFKRTAVKGKKINVNPAPMRGGIRLWQIVKSLILSLELSKNLKVILSP